MSVSGDPRAAALAGFLRERAALFSLSADVNDSPAIAAAGMALLEAAGLAEQLSGQDPLIVEMSERGMFETMPDRQSRVVRTDELDRCIQRSIAGTSRDGSMVLRELLDALPPWHVE